MKRRNEHRTRSRQMLFTGGACALALLGLLTVRSGVGGAQGTGPCDPPNGNPIVCENLQAGNPPVEWDVDGAGDPTIQGFATAISVNRGETVGFKIATDSTSYRLDIYRMGYYSGSGARKVTTIVPTVSLPQVQPACLTDPLTGLFDCGNWADSATWTVPIAATSGIYFARATRIDTGGASHIVFIVRDDASHADLFFQASDTTWQAYNQYGGNSLYVGAPGTNPGRAYKVSYNRPVTTRGTSPEDWVFNAEYPMVRFLESNGYNVAYAAGADTDRSGAALLQHKVFLSVGHDEYWSAAQRTNVEAARNAGVNLAFFSGNEVFWKTRWENSMSAAATPYRTLVSYKETHANNKIDPSPAWTGTWRDPRFSPPSDGGRPENQLTGTIFMVNTGTAAIQVPAADGAMRFWRNTSVAKQAGGAVATMPLGTLGFEWDEDLDNGFRPPGLVRLSDATVAGVSYLRNYGSTYSFGTANHALTFYRHTSGARVFGAGTVQWSWGLDANHDRGSTAPSVPMQQATINLLADMTVQPLTIQAGLITAIPSADTQAPASTISSPATNGVVAANTVVTITGTATDGGGGQVGGVEVSTDDGMTWHRALGRGAWSYSWTTGSSRTVALKSRAADDSGNIELPIGSRSVTVGDGAGGCPCTIWSNDQIPGDLSEFSGNSLEVGTRFRSDANGYITGIQFYRGAQNVGPHVGHLWTAGGTLLASATFGSESSSGWQQAPLSGPVAITANTTYVVSYYSPSGFYSGEGGYFLNSGVDNPPLHALQDQVDGRNGLYRYGASGFPTDSFQGANYWVDVVFATTVPPDTTRPVVGIVTPANGATNVSTTTNVTASFSESIDPASITSSTFVLKNGANVTVPAVVSYSGLTATLTPASPLTVSTAYTVRLVSGVAGVKDIAGNGLAADYVWSFSTQALPATGGPGGPVLVVSSVANPFSQYYAEILRAEGLNAFGVADLASVSASTLTGYDAVILGNVSLTSAQVTMFTNWVVSGGNLIAMRPDKQLATLLGLTDAGTTLAEGYMQVNTGSAPGTGIVAETMQFHGVADQYTLSGARAIAALYSNASTPTASPAVTVRTVGGSGGQAAAFTYDLARSVVATRQGNPGWSGQERDGIAPIRPDDLFFGGALPDYVDRSKIAIPQADEQQRLLANLIGYMNLDRKPLPKFWYFPRGAKAVVVMTGDDHGNNGTEGRFAIYNSNSPAGCRVDEWECVRGTSYIYPRTQISPQAAAAYVAQGFEIGTHISTSCADYTPSSLNNNYTDDLGEFKTNFPGLPDPRTNRTHCIPWSDYDTQPQVALAHGIRLDTNYYYWPDTWVNDIPGLFTGSGMPMRFTKLDGTLIDVYQAVTQMTDESGQSFPYTVDTLLNRALGAEGYYGAFVANMHTDNDDEPGSVAIVTSAQLRGVPIISARQLLDWLDGRNGSTFADINWDGTTLSFSVAAGLGANGLQTLLPATFNGHPLTALAKNGTLVSFEARTIKGVAYAAFDSGAGQYLASYGSDTTPPLITSVTAVPASRSAVIQWSTDEVSSSLVEYGLTATMLTRTATASGPGVSHTVTLTGLTPATTYFYRVTSADAGGNPSTSPAAPAAPASFATTALTNALLGDVAIDFGAGNGLWLSSNTSSSGRTWAQLHVRSPEHLAVADLDGDGQSDLIMNFPGSGVWIWSNNTTWIQLNPNDASDIVTGDLDGNGQRDVILSFPGYGIYAWMNNTSWVRLHEVVGSELATGNLDNDGGHHDEVVVNFPGAGVWIWTNNAAWIQLHPANATHIETGDLDGNGMADVVLDFAGSGLWAWMNNTNFVQRHGTNGGGTTVGNLDGDAGGRADVVVNFPGYGLWVLYNNTTWTAINSAQAGPMATADLDGNGQADLIASFPGYGLWVFMNNSTWSQLHPFTAEDVATGLVDH